MGLFWTTGMSIGINSRVVLSWLGVVLLSGLPLAPQAADLPRGRCESPLPNTDLRHCSFAGLRLEQLNLQGSLLDGVDLSNAQIPRCNLSHASLREADLKWASLRDCRMQHADLSGADLFHTTFDGAVLDHSLFTGANMFGANLNEVTARQADFTEAYMKDIAMEMGNFNRSVFIKAFMQRAVLIGSKLHDTRFFVAVLTGGALEEADFTRADLTSALVNGARLDNAIFRSSMLDKSRFTNAVLINTDFTNARNIPDHLRVLIDQQ